MEPIISTTILPGTFFLRGRTRKRNRRRNKLTKAKFAAMTFIERKGEQLVDEYPEIAELYRGDERFEKQEEIAKEFVEDYYLHPKVAMNAVVYALKLLMSDKDRTSIRRQRRTKQLIDIFGGFDTEAFREHCVRAARRRYELGIPVNTDAMVRGRGFIPWSNEEREYVIEMIDSGNRDYGVIAEEVNILFHDDRKVRTNKSVYDMVRYESRRKR